MLGLKLLIVAAVVVAVGGALSDAWQQLGEQQLTLRPGLALSAGVMFLVAQFPMAWFWRRTLIALGQPAPRIPALVAFYLSQIGKYVPGKAAVVLIRAERMLRSGGSHRLVVAAIFLETLTVMAVGALLAAVLVTLHRDPGEASSGWLVLLAGCLTVGCLVPTTPPVARWILTKLVAGKRSVADKAIGFTWGVMLQGWTAALLAWGGFGISVWLTAWSVSAVGSDDWQQPGIWVLAATLPMVAGFLSLLPAGVVVRDGLMLLILAPQLGEAGALATTLAVRLLWVVSETFLCVILVGIVDPPWKGKPDTASPDVASQETPLDTPS